MIRAGVRDALVITREDRERAAHALSAMASDRAYGDLQCTSFLGMLNYDEPAFGLASVAFYAAPESTDYDGRIRFDLVYAEAEAYVRCGYMPGDDPANPTGSAL